MFQDILPRESSYSKSPALPRSKPRSKDRLELLRVCIHEFKEGGRERKSLTSRVGMFPGRNGGSVISRSTETWFVPIMERRKRGCERGVGRYDRGRNVQQGQGKGCNRDLSWRVEVTFAHSDRTSQFDFPPLSHVDRHTAIDTQGVGAKPRNNRRRTVEQL